MTESMKTNHLVLIITLLAVGAAGALSACDGGTTPWQLEGRWAGTIEVGGDLVFARAEFSRTWRGLTGVLSFRAAGELQLVRSSQSSGEVLFEMKRGDEDLVFTGGVTNDLIVGNLTRGLERMRFQLHRIANVDRRLLQSYVGTYRVGSDWVRSIENCADESGWDQLIYIDHKTGGRKALFPTSEDTFFFGPGFLIPNPIEGVLTFLNGKDGRSRYLVWEQAGWDAMLGQRVDMDEARRAKAIVRRGSAPRCRPLSG